MTLRTRLRIAPLLLLALCVSIGLISVTPHVYASGVAPSADTVETLAYPDLLYGDGDDIFVHFADMIYLLFDDGRDSLDGFSPEYDYYDVYIFEDGIMRNANNYAEYAGGYTWRTFQAYLAFPDGTLVYDEPVVTVYLSLTKIAYIGGRVEVSVTNANANYWSYVVTVYNGTGDVTGSARATIGWVDDTGLHHNYYPPDGYTYTVRSPVTWITSDDYDMIVSETGTLISNIYITPVTLSPEDTIVDGLSPDGGQQGEMGNQAGWIDSAVADMEENKISVDRDFVAGFLPSADNLDTNVLSTLRLVFVAWYDNPGATGVLSTVVAFALVGYLLFGKRGGQ